MNIESDDGHRISKENRRKKKDPDKTRVITHQTKLAPHLPSKKELEKKRHENERRAVRKR